VQDRTCQGQGTRLVALLVRRVSHSVPSPEVWSDGEPGAQVAWPEPHPSIKHHARQPDLQFMQRELFPVFT
jgi:hypothetical protein